MKQVKFHPINANHLRKPNKNILNNIKESEEEFGIVLPLNRAGEITCSTCHNPHERGVLPKDKSNAQGASEKYRLRLAAKNLQICIACHKDKFQNMQLE
jgi:cytochrome c peroxidase